MAADKGKQFEYAVMLAAYGRITEELTGEVKSTFDTIMKNTNNGSTIDDEVMKAARQTMDRIQPVSNQQEFYKSFRQLGGGAGGGGEPKTDILYVLNGKKYSKDNSFIIPMNQPKRTLINAMFYTQTEFKDSLFYDVSAWTFPLAFNVNYSYTDNLSKSSVSKLFGEEVTQTKKPVGNVDSKSEYAYLFEPHEYYAQAAVYHLIKEGIRVKTATRKFSINGKEFDFGTYLIPCLLYTSPSPRDRG